MRIGDLSLDGLRTGLQRTGILFQSGPFRIRFRTAIPHVAGPFRLLYSDFDSLPDSAFSDFRIRIERARGIRRWLRPQATILFDGRPMFAPFPAQLSLAFLEWGLNWCIASHVCQFLIVHAAVLERGGRAVMLPGRPGSGKSTLCAAMVQRGWRLLSDELALIRPDDGAAVPMPRPISLKNESIRLVKQMAPGAVFGPGCPTARKGQVAHMRPPVASVEQARVTARPRWVIFPQYVAGSATLLSQLRKSRAFLRIAECSFNYSYLGTTGFETTKRLVNDCEFFGLDYGDLDDALGQITTVCS